VDALSDLATPPTAKKALESPPTAPAPDKSPGLVEQMIARRDKVSDDATKALGDINSKIMQFKPPDTPKLPPKPAPSETTPLDAWGSAAMVFAALAPMFVRSHATTAMNAAGNALKGIQQKDAEQTKYNLDVWKQETQNAIDLSNFQWKSYDALIGNLKFEAGLVKDITQEERAKIEGDVQALNFAFQNAGAIRAYKENGLKGVADFNQKQKEITSNVQQKTIELQKLIDETQDHATAKKIVADPANKDISPEEMATKLAPYDTKMAEVYKGLASEARQKEKEEADVHVQAKRVYDDWLAGDGKNATPQERIAKQQEINAGYSTRSGAIYANPSQLPEADRGALKQSFLHYEQEFPKINQQRGAGGLEAWTKLEEEIKKQNPNWSAARFKLVQAARNNITNGKDKDAIASFVRLHEHEEVVRALLKARKDGADEQALNKLASFWARQTGDTNITSLETALTLYSDELAKAVVGTGASALGDRSQMQEHFSTTLSDDQLIGNLDTADRMVGGAIVSKLSPYRNSGMQPQEISNAIGIDPSVLQSQYHIAPDIFQPTDTGKFKLGNAEVNIGKDGVGLTSENTVPTAPGGGWSFHRAGVFNGKPFGKKDGKWVYEDGTPVEGQ